MRMPRNAADWTGSVTMILPQIKAVDVVWSFKRLRVYVALSVNLRNMTYEFTVVSDDATYPCAMMLVCLWNISASIECIRFSPAHPHELKSSKIGLY